MCEFADGTSLLPGWGCCRCHAYNGLQRPACRRCRVERHDIVIPKDVVRCECGFGIRLADVPKEGRACPVYGCGLPLPTSLPS